MVSSASIQDIDSPFDLGNTSAYHCWREEKLSHYPMSLSDVVVEIGDPRALSDTERAALVERLKKANFAIYASQTKDDDDPAIPLAMGRQFGLNHLDHNWLSDDTGLTSLTVVDDGTRSHYIPYSNRPIKWHTDGYYNQHDKQIHSLLLHCTSAAAEGGENHLMDHEIAYILLRDEKPDYIRAFMDPEALSIPPRYSSDKIARPNEMGPVFSLTPEAHLHMRLSLRTHNVNWKDTPTVKAALGFLKHQLETNTTYRFKGRLESGMGLISTNILHDRSGFQDSTDQRRHLYRARYFDRVQF